MKCTRLFFALCASLWAGSLARGGDIALQKAHELELEVKNSERQSVISELNQNSPQEAAAHWLNGEIQVGDQWLPYRRVVDEGDRWAELHRYQEIRSEYGDTVDAQLFLADGCRHHKLFDEERAHLHGVIAADPEHAEARQRLGDQKIGGVWVTAEEAASTQRIIDANQRAYKAYSKNLTRLVKNLSDPKRRKAALDEIALIRDPAAIPVMEELLACGSERQQMDYLNWVEGITSWKASASMARLAVMSESAKVRVDATRELKSRRLEEFAPLVLASMVTPLHIETNKHIVGVQVLYSQFETFETQDKRYSFHYTARYAPQIIGWSSKGSEILSYRDRTSGNWNPNHNIQLGQQLFDSFSKDANQRSMASKDVVANWNRRRINLLTETIGLYGLDQPEDFWRFWEIDQGYLRDQKDEILAQYHEEWYSSRSKGLQREPFISRNRFYHSCFAAGTPIMTEFGSKPIESIVRGDRVLSQDIETGELAFKPVVGTTRRQSPESVYVKAGGEQYQCTGGHPFWVNGEGWRMARELAAGDRFHSMSGAVDVTGVDVADKVEVFNLVVADFHTYFVGKNPILTHDVTVRQPTDMLLPGYARPIATTAAK